MSTSVSFLIFLLAVANAVKLPESFARCKVPKELDFRPNDCLKHAVQQAIVKLSMEGDKELGVYDFDPLRINELLIDQGGDRPVAIKLTFSDSDLFGFRTTKVLGVEGKLSSPENFEMNIKFSLDNIELIGNYNINGKVLILPIQGEGKSNMTMTNILAKFSIRAEPQTKNGKRYLNVIRSQLELKPSSLHFDMQNLFKGNKALGDNMNKFLNENWEEIFNELKVSIQDAFGKVLEEYAKRILERVQFKNLFTLE